MDSDIVVCRCWFVGAACWPFILLLTAVKFGAEESEGNRVDGYI